MPSHYQESKKAARWSAETIKLLWQNRRHRILQEERDQAYQAYQRAIGKYEQIAKESPSISDSLNERDQGS